MAKILAIFVLALAAGSLVESALGAGLMKSIGRKFGLRHHARVNCGKHCAGGAATASATATASSSPAPSQHEYMDPMESHYYPSHQPYHNYPPHHQQPYHQPYQQRYQQSHYDDHEAPVYRAPRYEEHGGAASSSASAATSGSGEGAGAAAASAASANGGDASSSAAAAAAAEKQHHYVPPPSPYVRHNPYSSYSRPSAYPAPSLNIEAEIAAATAASAASSTSGHVQGAHIPAEYGTQAVYRDEAPIHYESGPHENVQYASSGTYAGDDGISENSYYKKNSESEKHHEHGSKDSDHYSSSKSHAKSGQENLRIRQGQDDLDHEVTKHGFKIKKRSNFNSVDWNKSKTETGAESLSKDHHRSNFHKDTIRTKEHVDAASTRYANGQMQTSGLTSRSGVDDEDSEYYDSDGIQGHPGYANYAGYGGYPTNYGGK